MREYPVEATGVGAEKEEGGDEEKRRRVAIRRVAANVVIEKTRVRHSITNFAQTKALHALKTTSDRP